MASGGGSNSLRDVLMEDKYALGHNPKNPIPIKHHIYRLPDSNGPGELHVTDEDGIHYLFSFTRNQAFSGARCLTEIISRMSSTGK